MNMVKRKLKTMFLSRVIYKAVDGWVIQLLPLPTTKVQGYNNNVTKVKVRDVIE